MACIVTYFIARVRDLGCYNFPDVQFGENHSYSHIRFLCRTEFTANVGGAHLDSGGQSCGNFAAPWKG